MAKKSTFDPELETDKALAFPKRKGSAKNAPSLNVYLNVGGKECRCLLWRHESESGMTYFSGDVVYDDKKAKKSKAKKGKGKSFPDDEIPF